MFFIDVGSAVSDAFVVTWLSGNESIVAARLTELLAGLDEANGIPSADNRFK